MSRVVVYAEVPSFYAEVERGSHPELQGRPILVGGDPRKQGTVQSASPEAKAAGVSPGMPVEEALALCPKAKALRTDMRRYRAASAQLRSCFRRALGRFESAGLGAAYFDASRLSAAPEAFAAELSQQVRAELGFPLQVGIAPVKFLAKLAAEEAGDEPVRRIEAGREAKFLEGLPVDRLPGVGPATAERLGQLGARSIGELSRLPLERVEGELGNHGNSIWNLAQGRDASPVRGAGHRKSLTQESSFRGEELDLQAIQGRLAELAEGLAEALALEQLRARRVTLKLRYADGELSTRTRTLDGSLAAAAEIQDACTELLERTQAGSRPLRGVGVTLGALRAVERDDRQLPLFG